MRNKKSIKKLINLVLIGIMCITMLSGAASAQTINTDSASPVEVHGVNGVLSSRAQYIKQGVNISDLEVEADVEIEGDFFKIRPSEACDITIISADNGGYEYTFETFKRGLKEDISEKDLSKAELLFNEATELSRKADKLWEKIYSMDIFNHESENSKLFHFQVNGATLVEGDINFQESEK